MNLFEKMSAITNDIKQVEKDLNISVGKGGYKAVSEGNILSAIKPLEENYKVYSYPANREIVSQEQMTDQYGKIVYFERIKTTYRFVNMEKPEEFIDMVSYGDGIDSGDKGVGKAMTYADKYALMKAYKIETGDDPDKEASQSYYKKGFKKPMSDKEAVEKVSEPLDKDLKLRCNELGVNLVNYAVYIKKNFKDLTNDDLKTAIAMKEERLNGVKQGQ